MIPGNARLGFGFPGRWRWRSLRWRTTSKRML